jgi:hypothetical protein
VTIAVSSSSSSSSSSSTDDDDDNETSGSIKCSDFLHWLLMKDSVSRGI